MKPWMFLVLILFRCSGLKYSGCIAETVLMLYSSIMAKTHQVQGLESNKLENSEVFEKLFCKM